MVANPKIVFPPPIGCCSYCGHTQEECARLMPTRTGENIYDKPHKFVAMTQEEADLQAKIAKQQREGLNRLIELAEESGVYDGEDRKEHHA